MYRITITPRAKKELKILSKLYKKAITEAIGEISEDPYMSKPLSRELMRRYSYRVGVYRIIYIINEKDKTVSIITAGHRSTIYN